MHSGNFAKSTDLSETVTEVTPFAKIPFKTTFFGVLLQGGEGEGEQEPDGVRYRLVRGREFFTGTSLQKASRLSYLLDTEEQRAKVSCLAISINVTSLIRNTCMTSMSKIKLAACFDFVRYFRICRRNVHIYHGNFESREMT